MKMRQNLLAGSRVTVHRENFIGGMSSDGLFASARSCSVVRRFSEYASRSAPLSMIQFEPALVKTNREPAILNKPVNFPGKPGIRLLPCEATWGRLEHGKDLTSDPLLLRISTSSLG